MRNAHYPNQPGHAATETNMDYNAVIPHEQSSTFGADAPGPRRRIHARLHGQLTKYRHGPPSTTFSL